MCKLNRNGKDTNELYFFPTYSEAKFETVRRCANCGNALHDFRETWSSQIADRRGNTKTYRSCSEECANIILKKK